MKNHVLATLHPKNDDGQRRREKALADALAGVVASLISLWVFYPMEVVKINTQAAVVVPATSHHHHPAEEQKVVVHDPWQWQRLWAGIRLKSVATASSSFCYFYLYSWILSLYHHQRHHLSHHHHHIVPAGTRLGLAAVAAILNTLLTLPLDVLSTRQQTTTKNSTVVSGENLEEKDNDSKTNNSHQEKNNPLEAVVSFWDSDEFSDPDDQCMANNIDCQTSRTEEDTALRRKSLWCRRPSELLREQLYPYKTLWKGLVPSLLLCSNPAIHYTVFDVVKGWILQRPGRRTTGTNDSRHLTLMESFWIGWCAKFLSTMITYPLIRAKVKLMVQNDRDDDNDGSTSHTNQKSNITSLWGSLCHEFRHHGVAGLYQGCHWQLCHTLLKSALLMMLRERIETTTRRWLVVEESSTEESMNCTATK